MHNHMIRTGIEIAAMVAVAFQPVLAETSESIPTLPWPAQLGVISMLGGLLWWQMARQAPDESKRRGQELDRMLEVHRTTTVEICDDIKTMTADIRTMTSGTQKLNDTLRGRPCMLPDEVYKKIVNGD